MTATMAVPAGVPGTAVARAADDAGAAGAYVEPGAPDAPDTARRCDLDDAVDACRAALDRLAAADRWTAAERRAALAQAEKVASIATAMRARLLTAERDAGTWSLRGDRDFASWVGRASHEGRGSGRAQVGEAATLAAMPALADALVDGPVTPVHVQQLTRAAGASPLLAAHLATDEGQAQVLELAGRLDGAAFGKELARRAASLDPASRQREHDEQYANRSLLLTHTRGGTLISGRLDSVAGHRFQLALDALCPRPAQNDPRDRGQRQADAVVGMSERVLSDTQTTPGAVVPPQVLVTMTQDTWLALRAGRDDEQAVPGRPDTDAPSPSHGSTADVVRRLRDAPAVLDEDGHVLPAGEVARLLCDCELTRVLVDAEGLPLDVGRSQRLFTPAQRRAIHVRDGDRCAYPGCSVPFRYTEMHHMAWWDRDRGHTSLDNGFPGCTYHHAWIHRNDIRISRNRAGRYVLRHPDGRLVPGSAPPDPPEAEPCPAAPYQSTSAT